MHELVVIFVNVDRYISVVEVFLELLHIIQIASELALKLNDPLSNLSFFILASDL